MADWGSAERGRENLELRNSGKAREEGCGNQENRNGRGVVDPPMNADAG
jgi:hypothetical protein